MISKSVNQPGSWGKIKRERGPESHRKRSGEGGEYIRERGRKKKGLRTRRRRKRRELEEGERGEKIDECTLRRDQGCILCPDLYDSGSLSLEPFLVATVGGGGEFSWKLVERSQRRCGTPCKAPLP